MDEASAETIHDLLLDLAGRVDDDLLAWARELVAVGETQHAFEVIGATLVADRAELPPAARAALVEVARSVRTELDVDGALAPPRADGSTAHRFDSAPAPDVVAAVRSLPTRLLGGCRVLLTHRLTPAGSAPGPLPHPVVLIEVPAAARNRDVLAYQLADALDRAGVRASVEVMAAGAQPPAYHVAALRQAQPVPPAGPGGPGHPRSVEAPATDRPGAGPQPSPGGAAPEPAPRPVPLRAAGERTPGIVVPQHDRVETVGAAESVWVGPEAAGSEGSAAPASSGPVGSDQGGPDRAGSSQAGRERAGLGQPGRDQAASDRDADRLESDWAGSDRGGSSQAGSNQLGSDRVESSHAGTDSAGSNEARADRVDSDGAGSDRAGSDRAGSDRAGLDRGRLDRGGLERAGLDRAGLERAGSDRAGSDRAGSDRAGSDRAGSDRAGSDRAGSDRAGSDRAGSDRAGSDRVGSDRAGSDRAGSDQGGLDQAGSGQARSVRPGSDHAVSDQVGVDGAGSDRARSERLGLQRGGSAWAGSDWAEAERAASEWAGIESVDTHRAALDGPESDRPGSHGSESDQPGPGRPGTEESAFGGPAFEDVGSDAPGSEEPGHDGSESDSSGTGRQGSDQPGSDRPEFGGPGFREPGFGGPQFGVPDSGGRGSSGTEFESVGSGPTPTPPAGQPFTAVTREPGSELRPGPRPIPADRAPRPAAGRVPPHRDLASAVRLVPPGEADAADPGAEEHRPNPPERAPQPAVAELPQRRRRDPVDGTGPLERVGEPEPTGERRHRYLIERDAAAGTSTAGPLPIRGEGGNTEPLAIRAPLGRPATGPAERSGSGRPASAPDSSTTGAVEGAASPAELGLRPESVARLSASGRELLARLQAELQGGPQLGSRPGGHNPNGSTGPQARVDPPDLAG